MDRTIKDATVKRCDYNSHQQLEAHLQTFSAAYNFGRRRKTLKGGTRCLAALRPAWEWAHAPRP